MSFVSHESRCCESRVTVLRVTRHESGFGGEPRCCQRLASIYTTVQVKTTSGPIHGHIVEPEGLFKFELGSFSAWG